MPDDSLPVNDPHNVPVTFANQVVGFGHFQGVINVTLAVARFTPTPDGTVDPDMAIVARLRMDLACAQQLHDQLGQLLAPLQPANGTTH